MKHTKISTLIFAASICCTKISHAVDWKKMVAAVALVGSCNKIATDPSFVPMVGNSTRAFADGVAACSFITFGSASGMYTGHQLTAGNPAAVCAGIVGGGSLGAVIADTTGSSLDLDMKGKPIADRIAKRVGCGCGQAVGVLTAGALFNQ